ncbi:hypothetical protein EDD16DRAFT_1523548 [Pisolithus croceorrhizus]|nr:hypothetical protein EDD16DRAFT_1523548 [Pisolithus croceorrhizus]KAI6133471.1 hypothetical protein EV401DRAFT_1883379 [Pisolithus croceorrhizus]KAI6165769.1 hypothetical protein EDD17DRAFT_1505771 [Pisolithus thermaeus]
MDLIWPLSVVGAEALGQQFMRKIQKEPGISCAWVRMNYQNGIQRSAGGWRELVPFEDIHSSAAFYLKGSRTLLQRAHPPSGAVGLSLVTTGEGMAHEKIRPCKTVPAWYLEPANKWYPQSRLSSFFYPIAILLRNRIIYHAVG